MPLPRITKHGASREMARLITGQFNSTTPPGIVRKQSPTGDDWRDEKLKPFPARITGDGSSSSDSSSSGSNFSDRYDWEEVIPLPDKTFVTKENGRFGTSDVRPAIEANGITDIESGTIVYLYPAIVIEGGDDWYYFFAGESDSSSDQVAFTVDCEAGTIIIGSGGTTTNPPTGKPTDGTSSSGGIAPIDNNTIFGGGGPGVTEGVTPGTP